MVEYYCKTCDRYFVKEELPNMNLKCRRCEEYVKITYTDQTEDVDNGY